MRYREISQQRDIYLMLQMYCPGKQVGLPYRERMRDIPIDEMNLSVRSSNALMRSNAKTFGGVAHRAEFVREYKGVRYYNDSIASSPTRTALGTLSLYKEKIIIIAGGYDKHIPYEPLGPVINDKVKTLILLGDTAPKIEAAVKGAANYRADDIQIINVTNMEEAVAAAAANAVAGDIVSLSPASASFGLYKNFEERGNHFKSIVNGLQ